MENVTINDLREVATLQEIGDAFGVSAVAVKYWEQKGDIPDRQRYRYSAGLLPDGKAKALKIYKRALKHMRTRGEK